MLGEMCLAKDSVAGAREFVQQVEHRRRQASGEEAKAQRVPREALAEPGGTEADLGRRRERGTLARWASPGGGGRRRR